MNRPEQEVAEGRAMKKQKVKPLATWVAMFEAHTGRIVRLGEFKQTDAPLALAEARARFGPLHKLRVIAGASLRESPLIGSGQNGRAA